ncbi:MAG TPA: 30S ribosomal protein S1 [Nitrospiraceae bacterium]|nr:30S ribosomal protein S1 [Nitrospiraceae bacterium]
MIDKEQDFEYEGEERTGEQGQNEFENLYNQSLKSFKQGSVVKGTIAQVLAGSVMVDVGYKSDGMIPVDQFTADELASLQPGDEIEVFLESGEDSHGNLRLSREKAKRMQAWDHLNNAYQSGSPIKSKVLAKVKGGLSVDIGVSAFLPGSQIDMRPLRNLDQYLGKVLDVKIIKMNPGRGNIVVSRRAILEQQSASQKEETLAKLADGQTVKGIVKNITDYGAFIDLGGIDGLLHITDMAWRRVRHPSEVVTAGQEITAKILKFDTEKNRVSLGLKQMGDDPWMGVNRRYPQGTRLFGKVTNIADYGAFVELEPGIEGLVHVSEMDWTNKNIHPSKVVQVGDEVEVMVLDIDEERRRISLGIKQCKSNPWEDFSAQFNKGDRISGTIKSITDFGIFIGLDGGIDGLVHLSDISWNEPGEEAVRRFKKGDELDTVILSVDPERERISLGIKQLEDDPFSNYAAVNDKGSIVRGTVKEVDAKGAIIDLGNDIEATLKASEISRDRVEDARNVLKEGDEVEAKIISIDRKSRVISLSIKSKDVEDEKDAMKELRTKQDVESTGPTTIGDLIRAQMENQN